MGITVNGTSITFNDATVQTTAPTLSYTLKELLTTGTYTPPSSVKNFVVYVYGASGGSPVSGSSGGIGGIGYAEKYYTAPFTGAPYSYACGAAGTFGGSAAGTTSFATISVTGSGNGVSGGTGGAGGVATGGGFNANGGAGGAGRTTATVATGGSGGSGTRAGNGGTGGNAISGTSGGGGGTGGNNASGVTPGIAATTTAAGAIVLPTVYGVPENAVYYAGGIPNGVSGSTGSRATVSWNEIIGLFNNIPGSAANILGAPAAQSNGANGIAGRIFVLEGF